MIEGWARYHVYGKPKGALPTHYTPYAEEDGRAEEDLAAYLAVESAVSEQRFLHPSALRNLLKAVYHDLKSPADVVVWTVQTDRDGEWRKSAPPLDLGRAGAMFMRRFLDRFEVLLS